MDLKRRRPITGFLLAGGASSRMGRDKGLLELGGVPLILRTARLLEPFVSDVTIVGSPRRYAALGLSAIEDDAYAQGRDKSRCGPLAGIATALAATNARWNLILACDLPYLSAEWIDWLLSRAMRSRGEAVVPQTERGMEPLAAVYRRECGAPIAAALAGGVRKVSDAIKRCRVDLVYAHEWRRIDRSGLILRNMNSPGDYEEAQKWWAANRPPANERVTARQRKPQRKPRSAPRRRR
jgi:molybdopterin-guanine dinucleotide biosynthesis protein A